MRVAALVGGDGSHFGGTGIYKVLLYIVRRDVG
jgi:hypothetical protein